MTAKRRNLGRKASAKALLLANCHRPQYQWVVHVFTEGDTEYQYLKDIAQDRCVRVVRDCQPISSPAELLQEAKDWAFKNRTFLGSSSGKNHVIWVLFDDDEKPEIRQVIKDLKKTPSGCRPEEFFSQKFPKIHIGYMKPCIELWGAMTVCGSLKSFPHTHSGMESFLAKVMKNYSHKDTRRYFDVEQMVNTDWALDMAAKWESTYGEFPSCHNAAFFAGIYRLVNLILSCPKKRS